MAHWNGSQGAIMTAKAEQSLTPEENPTSGLHIWLMRIWIACALIIVASGVANYLLCQFVGEVK